VPRPELLTEAGLEGYLVAPELGSASGLVGAFLLAEEAL
jgi:hypothetical protein